MGIPFTLPMGFLFTVTMGFLLTISTFGFVDTTHRIPPGSCRRIAARIRPPSEFFSASLRMRLRAFSRHPMISAARTSIDGLFGGS